MIYDNCPAFISHSIEQVQRRAALACTGAYRDTSHVSLLKELGWPTLSKRREYYKICQMYKLQNKISPAYLVGHLPLNRADHAYALRNKNDIRVPLSRTISFRNSFIPSSIRLWNAVDPSIQNCSSLSSFKRHLRNSNFPKANPLFSYGKGRGPVYHARIRMGLSALNQQRYKYNFIPHASCNSCNYRNEDPVHYFRECPTYQLARTNLLQSVDPILTDIFQDINELVNRRSKERLIQIMLNGNLRLDKQQNLRIFESVHCYVLATGRMKWP